MAFALLRINIFNYIFYLSNLTENHYFWWEFGDKCYYNLMVVCLNVCPDLKGEIYYFKQSQSMVIKKHKNSSSVSSSASLNKTCGMMTKSLGLCWHYRFCKIMHNPRTLKSSIWVHLVLKFCFFKYPEAFQSCVGWPLKRFLALRAFPDPQITGLQWDYHGWQHSELCLSKQDLPIPLWHEWVKEQLLHH